MDATGAEISIVFVPAKFFLNAAKDALNSGIKLLVAIPEHVPIRDAMEVIELAKQKDAIMIGPNTPAISLHAPNNELRKKLVPTATSDSVEEIIKAGHNYFKKTGRRVTFEYALMEGINDSREIAYELAELLRGNGSHVNLIPITQLLSISNGIPSDEASI